VEPVIQTHGLTKRFGDLTAVDHIDLSVMKGEIFGFLGPNGAGKTTAMRMLSTLSKPTEGTATVGGYDIVAQAEQVRKIIGMVAEKLILYPRLSGVENLEFFGRLYGMKGDVLNSRVDELLRMVRLERFKDMPAGGYSSGMRQRLNIVRGVIHDPEIVFMDEPTVLLDPQSTSFVRDLIRDLNKEGKTIVLTTHVMDEADRLSDTIGIIDHGKIIAVDSPRNLREKHHCETLEDVFLELTGRALRDSATPLVPMRRVMGRS